MMTSFDLLPPKTVEDLVKNIEAIFVRLGESKRACEFVGEHPAYMHTYLCGKSVEEGASRDSKDYYFPTKEGALAATWEEIKKLRYDPAYKVTKEEMEDGMPFRFLPSRIIWRSLPEFIETPNGIFTLRMRAAFI